MICIMSLYNLWLQNYCLKFVYLFSNDLNDESWLIIESTTIKIHNLKDTLFIKGNYTWLSQNFQSQPGY